MKYPKQNIKVDKTNKVVISFACNKQIKAIAKCSPEDTFDEHFGKRYVSAKLKKTYAKLALQRAKEQKRKLLKILDAKIAELLEAVNKQELAIEAIRLEKYPETAKVY
jgi:hypothetical protein